MVIILSRREKGQDLRRRNSRFAQDWDFDLSGNWLTQEEFALRAGLGLRFVRELEQGKETVRMDKVNQALRMFGMEAVPGRIRK